MDFKTGFKENVVNKKRIFIAVPISNKLQQEIFEWEKKYKNLPVRWLAGKNIHITLIPPWDENDIESVVAKLNGIKGKPFGVEFDKVSYGPNFSQPRLIWAEGKAPEEIISLKNELEKIFPQHKSDHKRWLMHLTIARFRPEEFFSFPIKLLNEKALWQDEINSFALMESRLSRSGADYEILKEFRL